MGDDSRQVALCEEPVGADWLGVVGFVGVLVEPLQLSPAITKLTLNVHTAKPI
jgi:hypothetical protein